MTQKFHPILFSTEMVQAILAGNKTMTRRVVKPQPPGDYGFSGTDVDRASGEPIFYACWEGDDNFHNVKCPYGQPGDILWVRETHAKIIGPDGAPYYYSYKQQDPLKGDFVEDWQGWTPSIFMPKEACRLFLQIKSIRVERLQDISQQDAKAEGVAHVIDKITGYCGYDYINGGYNLMTSPYNGFASLWKKINGTESWDANPWVWVVEFEKIEKPEGFIS